MSADTVLVNTPEPPAGAPPPRKRWSRRRVRLAGLLCGLVLVLGGSAAVQFWPKHSTGSDEVTTIPVSWRRPVVSAAGLVQRSGVQIKYVAITGGDGLVDLRFRVIDADLAGDLHSASKPPAVVDEASGLVVHDLLMSHSHSGPFKAGLSYYLIFNNPGNWIHRGSVVTVLLGNAAVEHVVVQ
jgi:hypothetical protein